MAINSIEFRLSGGISNANVATSLGGAMSSVNLVGNTVSYATTGITGVTLIDSLTDNAAVGNLSYIISGTKINKQKPLGIVPSASDLVDISVDGDYVIIAPEEDAMVAVSVVSSSLPIADTNDDVTAVKINPNLFGDVAANESEAGITSYRHVYLFNKSAIQVVAKLYIANNYSGLDALSIGFENVISGVTDQLITDDQTPPVGVAFNAPASAASAIELTINTGDAVGMFLKRVVSPLSDNTTAIDTARLLMEQS